MKNLFVKKYEKEKRWVNYRMVKMKGRTTKIPYTVLGTKASSTSSGDWSTYADVKKKSQQVGIIFTPDRDLLGIDIDHCLTDNKITHEQKEVIADLILEADTYTEVSPSGEGLHIMLALSEPLDLVSNKNAPFEAYTCGRYFTFTGKAYGEEKEVRVVSIDEANRILSIMGYPWKKSDEERVSREVGGHGNLQTGASLTDDQVLTKLFSSKKGKKAQVLYEGSLADYKEDASSGDMALLSHLAFWTGKDAIQMERIWLASPLGQRKKTQDPKNRINYVVRSIDKAIAGCNTTYEPAAVQVLKASEGVDLDLLFTMVRGDKKFSVNTENMCRILRRHPNFAGRLRYDEFKNVFEIYSKDKWRTIEDNDAVILQTAISIHFVNQFPLVSKGMVYDAMIKVAKENQVDSAADWIRSLSWDGVPRLDSWLEKTCGVPDDAYHRAVASNWLKGLVKRIIHPGCKFDHVLVLEGDQGIGKSTLLSALGRDWHVETAMSTDSKDFFMQFQGKAIIEFSEGETLNRTEVKRMKAIITMQNDKYRPPYERSSQDFPRRCVFAMTTNQSEYLKDETGNRRWLPVAVALPKADIGWLEANRDQLFAEAYQRIEVGKETIYEFPIEETLAHQKARQISDPNTDVVVNWYFEKVTDDDKMHTGSTLDRAFKEALHGGFISKPITKWEQMSIAGIFKDALNLDKRDVVRNSIRSMRWFAKEGATLALEDETLQESAVRNF